MQSGSNFTDRIVKYVAKRAERKTKPASPPRGHVIPPDSASCRAGGVAGLGWITTPGVPGGRGELEHVGHPRNPCVSALPIRGGCELSPILSRSLGTSGLQLESPMALPSTGRAGVGSRVCTGTGSGLWCSGGENSVHTRPTGGTGSSCADPPGSMPGGTVRVLVSSAQSGRLSMDGNRRTSSP